MNWHVEVVESAQKYLRRVPLKDYARIEAVIDSLEHDPYSGDIAKLGGYENAWRRRVGNYRLKYSVQTNVKFIYVFEIKRRTSNTY